MYPHKLPLDDSKDPKDAHANFNFSCEIQRNLPIGVQGPIYIYALWFVHTQTHTHALRKPVHFNVLPNAPKKVHLLILAMQYTTKHSRGLLFGAVFCNYVKLALIWTCDQYSGTGEEACSPLQEKLKFV